MRKGKVYLVGAGPGDPGLITVKGLDCLKKADTVVYDHLIDLHLLEAVPARTKKLYVGKSAQSHTLEQEGINQLLAGEANRGKTVVRLKGGDPFVLGRGGEEAQFLASKGIPFEVVPGVSSAVAIPAYAGIPVTHRGLASSFAVMSGHKAAGKDKPTVAWDKISTGTDTLVILMTVRNLGSIVASLIANGRPPSTPAAIVSNGASPRQLTVVGRLDNIVIKAKAAGVQPPSVMVVGEVVRLREHMRWFDNQPLFGKRVLVTRPKTKASQLGQLLRERGAVPIEIPAIIIEAAPSNNELDHAILNLKNYDWLIFTSVNGIEAFFSRFDFLNKDVRWLGHLRIGAIGPATAQALKDLGLCADCVPEKYTSRSLLTELRKENMFGRRILLPRSDIAGKDLSRGLARLGAEVHEIAVYRTIPNVRGLKEAKKLIITGEIDIITFTSSSTVTNLVKALGKKQKVPDNIIIACIGPVTAATAARAGLRVNIVARKNTVIGLMEAMEEYFTDRG